MESKNALVLGGGGARGAYEAGVWKALRELEYNIDIVCGTSVGAINGAMVVQDKFHETIALWNEIETHMIFNLPPLDKDEVFDSYTTVAGLPLDEARRYVKELFSNKGADTSGLQSLLKEYINEDFLRASPIDYGLVTVSLPHLEPFFLYKENIPKGKIVDFIVASASCFPAVKSHEIDGVHYIDGAYHDNLPISMALNKGATKIIAVNLDSMGLIKTPKHENKKALTTIKSLWDLGNILNFDKEKAPGLIQLGYLETLKAFKILEGSFYSFSKGEFTPEDLEMADIAAKTFDLNPEIIYQKNSLNLALNGEIQASKRAIEQKIKYKGRPANSTEFRNRLGINLQRLEQKVNKKTLVITLAEEMKERDISFDSPGYNASAKLLQDPVLAATYLIKEGLI